MGSFYLLASWEVREPEISRTGALCRLASEGNFSMLGGFKYYYKEEIGEMAPKYCLWHFLQADIFFALLTGHWAGHRWVITR
jgi:hypothetical protein